MKCGWLLWRPPVLQHSGDNNSATNNHLANSDFCWRRHWSVISGDSLQLYNAQNGQLAGNILLQDAMIFSDHTVCVPASSQLSSVNKPSPSQNQQQPGSPSAFPRSSNATMTVANPSETTSPIPAVPGRSSLSSSLSRRRNQSTHSWYRFDLAVPVVDPIQQPKRHQHSFLTNEFSEMMEWLAALIKHTGEIGTDGDEDGLVVRPYQSQLWSVSDRIFPESLASALARSVLRGSLSYFNRSTHQWSGCKGVLSRENFHIVLTFECSHSTHVVPMDPFLVTARLCFTQNQPFMGTATSSTSADVGMSGLITSTGASLPPPPPDRPYAFEFQFVSSGCFSFGSVLLCTDTESSRKQWIDAISGVLRTNLVNNFGDRIKPLKSFEESGNVNSACFSLPDFVRPQSGSLLAKRPSLRNTMMLLNRSKTVSGGTSIGTPPSPPSSRPRSRMPSVQTGMEAAGGSSEYQGEIPQIAGRLSGGELTAVNVIPTHLHLLRKLQRASSSNNRKSLVSWFSQTSKND